MSIHKAAKPIYASQIALHPKPALLYEKRHMRNLTRGVMLRERPMASLSQGLSQEHMVVVFGGSGFVGRHIVRQLTKTGCRVRVAVRRPNEALFLKTAGRVGQVEIVAANIRDDDSVQAALEGGDAVVNAVGILYETGKQKFASVQADGAARIARLAARQNMQGLVHLSAIGADANSASSYATSKAAGEHAVVATMANAHILRPSIVVGPEDDFFNRFAAMSMLAPALPLVGGGATLYQPVSVFDVAQAVVACLNGAPSGIYELGGPQTFSFKQLLQMMLAHIGRKRFLVPLPFFAANIIARVAQFMPTPILTPDQVTLLKSDNIVSEAFGDRGLSALGVEATPIETILPSYLARYRPEGKIR
jgi:NADH dehydrogenase